MCRCKTKRDVATIFKVKDPRMLQISINNRNHMDALGSSRKAGPKAAHAAHDQIDPHTGLGSIIERFDDRGIDETVYFRNDASGLTGTRLFSLATNKIDKVLPQPARRQDQVMKALWPGIACQQVEKFRQILAKALSTSEESDIAVNTTRPGVIVPGREVTIAANTIGLLPDYEARLTMGFIAD